MLRARLAVAAVGLPLLVLLVALPEPAFGLIVALLLGAAAFELTHAAAPARGVQLWGSAAAVTAVVATAIRTIEGLDSWPTLLIVPLALYAALRPAMRERQTPELWWLVSVAYLGVLGGQWLLLRNEPDGRDWIVVVLAVTFATDTGAYTIGRLTGRHLLAPRISPKKTWEGAAGGYAAGALAAIAAPLVLDLDPRSATLAVMAATVPVAAIVGDLVESAIKRRIGIKDFSHLLPGHGGLLDRMDSLLLAGPLLYWILRWVET